MWNGDTYLVPCVTSERELAAGDGAACPFASLGVTTGQLLPARW